MLTTAGAASTTVFQEYTAAGALVRALSVPASVSDGVYPNSASSVAQDAGGKLFVIDGVFAPSLAAYDPVTTSWSQQTFPNWNHYAAAGVTGLAVFENFVYANDETVAYDRPGDSAGVVRFNLDNHTATRFQFAGSTDINTLTIGLDGNLYAMGGTGGASVFVIDPISMALKKTVNLPFLGYMGLAANAAGDIFAAIQGDGVVHFDSTGMQVGTVSLPSGDGSANSIALAPDGTIAVGTTSGFVVKMTSALTNITSFDTGSGWSVFVAFAADTPAAGPVSLSKSTVSITPASIEAGASTTVILQARDATGQVEHDGGLAVAFTLGNGVATGAFGSVNDNGNGTYTATFTAGTVVGTNTISATIGGLQVTSTPAALTVTPARTHHVLLTTADGNVTDIQEYAPAGALLRTIAVPPDINSDIYENVASSIVEDTSGNIYVQIGGFACSLGIYSAATSTWTQDTLAGWNHVAQGGDVGLAIFQNYAYANDMTVGAEAGGTSNGVIRFDLTTGIGTRFQYGGGADINTLAIGLDGNLYAFSGNNLFVIDPLSMALQRTIVMPFLDYRGVAVAANGDIFTPVWDGYIAHFDSIGNQLATIPMPSNYDTGNPLSIGIAADGTLDVGTRSGFVLEMTSAFTNETVFSVGSGSDVYVNFPAGAGPVDLAQSVVSVSPVSLPIGGTTNVTLTAKDANGIREQSGGLIVDFALGNGNATGTFSTVTDNGNGTYSATLTGTGAGSGAITATIGGQPLTSTLPNVLIYDPAAVLFSDDFNLPDNSPLAPAWQTLLGSQSIVSGQVQGIGVLNLARVNGISRSDMAVQADVNTAAGQHAGVVARYTANGNGYVGRIKNTGASINAEIDKVTAGLWTKLVSTPVSAAAGTLRLEAVGTSLKLFFGSNPANLSLVAYTFDGSLTAAGSAGIETAKNARLDNFAITALSLTTPTLPFQETFGPTTYHQLSTNWAERSGNFRVVDQGIVPLGATGNLATVNGVLGDSAVQADVTIGLNQYADVFAHYNPATGSRYSAHFYNAGGKYYTALYRYYGSTPNLLAGPTLVGSNTGTMRLEVVGASLKLFFGPNASALTVVDYAYSSAQTAPGLVGIRSSKGATFANFLADAITLTTPKLPFRDSFAQPTGSQLSPNWLNRAGNFSAANNQMAGAATLNLATVNGVLGDSTVQADVTIGLNQYADVIAHYNPATGSMYSAHFYYAGGKYYTALYRFAGSTRVLLAGPTLVGSNTGTMRLEVVGASLKLFFGPDASALTVVDYAYSSALTAPGLVGIRSGKGASFANFLADVITLTTPKLPFRDPLAQPTGSQLSPDWLNRAGNYAAANNQMVGAAPLNLATVNGLILANSASTMDVVVAAGQQAGLVARYDSKTGNRYVGRIISVGAGFQAQIVKILAGVTTVLKSASVASGAGTISFQLAGRNLKLLYGPDANDLTLAAYAYDGSLSSGANGIISSKLVALANFATDALPIPPSQNLPFSDNFAANPPTQQLSINWLEQDGNFSVATGAAVGQAKTNLALVNGSSSANADVQATVNLTALGQYAGLVARYSGPGEQNMYLAQIAVTAVNTCTVTIYRNLKGVFTSLGHVVTTSFAGSLRFTVAGSGLSVFLDGSSTAILSLTDTAIAGQGTVGIRASLGVSVSGFTAN